MMVTAVIRRPRILTASCHRVIICNRPMSSYVTVRITIYLSGSTGIIACVYWKCMKPFLLPISTRNLHFDTYYVFVQVQCWGWICETSGFDQSAGHFVNGRLSFTQSHRVWAVPERYWLICDGISQLYVSFLVFRFNSLLFTNHQLAVDLICCEPLTITTTIVVFSHTNGSLSTIVNNIYLLLDNFPCWLAMDLFCCDPLTITTTIVVFNHTNGDTFNDCANYLCTARQFSLLTRFPASALETFPRSLADFADHSALSCWLAFCCLGILTNVVDDDNTGVITFFMRPWQSIWWQLPSCVAFPSHLTLLQWCSLLNSNVCHLMLLMMIMLLFDAAIFYVFMTNILWELPLCVAFPSHLTLYHNAHCSIPMFLSSSSDYGNNHHWHYKEELDHHCNSITFQPNHCDSIAIT